MKIYHSSDVVVCRPDTIHSREYLDFGKGFYLITSRKQAEAFECISFVESEKIWIR